MAGYGNADLVEVIRHYDGVLIVEDNALLAWDAREQLAALGFGRVHLANSLLDASNCLLETPIRFAVLDVNLGEELVFPLAIDLRERAIPFVFCTARRVDELPLEWTAYPVLSKPFNNRQFMQVLCTLAH